MRILVILYYLSMKPILIIATAAFFLGGTLVGVLVSPYNHDRIDDFADHMNRRYNQYLFYGEVVSVDDFVTLKLAYMDGLEPEYIRFSTAKARKYTERTIKIRNGTRISENRSNVSFIDLRPGDDVYTNMWEWSTSTLFAKDVLRTTREDI